MGEPAEVLGVGDAGEVLTLQRAAYVTEAAAHNDFGLAPLVQTLGELRAELAEAGVVALGIRERGRLVAAVRLRRSGDEVELGRLTVAPDRQGNGLGTGLLTEAETVCTGARSIRLFTGEHSLGNIRLYIRAGYRETGRTSVGGYHLVNFVKMLDGPPG
jgi:ribosomal protein S18 acetylase RimI-like enzyme